MMLSTYAQGPNGPDRRRDLSSKVLVLNQYFPPDTASTGRYVSTIASRLADEGFDVTAVVSQPSYGADLPLAPARESVDGVEVGFVTQAITSPLLGGKTLGLAKVPKAMAQSIGTGVTARVGGKDVTGEIVQHPVYDKERKRAKES